jgi:rhodanese-related sulfurtransferase
MKKHSQGFLGLVQDALTRVKEIDITHVNTSLKNNEKPIIIDVREDSEWAQGHLPNAVHLGKGIIERDIEKLYPHHDQPLILYCGGGFRSALACDNIQKMGYTQVLSMKGGYSAWLEAGYEICPKKN